MLSALVGTTDYLPTSYETPRPSPDGAAAAADAQLRTSRATAAVWIFLSGPAAHADVLGTRSAFEYGERGAPHQLGGGRGGGRIFERDEADAQPRTRRTECQVDAVEQALPEPGAPRPAGPRCHNPELCGADPPHRIRETGPAAQRLRHAIPDSPVVPHSIAIDVHHGDADRGAVADRRGQELLGSTEQAAVIPQPAAIVQQSLLARPIRFRLRAELGSEAEAKLLRIHRLTPQLVGTGAQGFDALGPRRCACLGEEDRRAGGQPTVPPQGSTQRQTATLIRQLHGNNRGVGTRPVLLLERIERRRRPEHGVSSRRQDGL